MERTVSLEVASTVPSPPASTTLGSPSRATVSLLMTSTSAPRPTPAVPPMASVPAVPVILVRSLAATATCPPEVTAAASSVACVVLERMSMVTAPATPASPPTVPPTATRVMSSCCAAETETPPAPATMVSPDAMVASMSAVRTRIEDETPTPALLPTAISPAYSSSLRSSSLAEAFTAPVVEIVVPGPATSAVTVGVRTTTMREPLTLASSDAAASTETTKTCSLEVAVTATSPPAFTVVPAPIVAATVLRITSTSMPMPTPASPVVSAIPPARLTIFVLSVAETVTPPVVERLTPVPIDAVVEREKTSTMTEPVTEASPVPAPPATATELTGGSVKYVSAGSIWIGCKPDVAVTATVPPATIAEPAPIEACVSTSYRMLTAIAPPTASPPSASAPETASVCSPSGAVAFTVTPPPSDVMLTPAPIVACVLYAITWMPTDAATLASDLPPAAARPHVTKSFSLPTGVIASTVTPWPETTAPSPIVASFVASTTLRPTAAPMLSSASRLPLRPVAFADASVQSLALTSTGLAVPVTCMPAAIVAVFDVTTQLTAMAAATPTPPPESPDSLLAWSFPCDDSSLEDGSDGIERPLVFELPLIWLFDVESALWPPLPELSLPSALAVALAALDIVDSAITETPEPLTLRSIDAAVLQPRTTLMATPAPTASSPPASAFADVFEMSAVCVAWTVT